MPRVIPALCLLTLLCATTLAQETINRGDRAKIRKTRETLSALALDLATVRQMQGEYPGSLKALIDASLREALPKDAWDRDFAYETSTEHGFRLTSWGADGKAGGVGAGRDIVWTKNGELREMTAAELSEYQAKLKAARQQAERVLARARMVQAGAEVVNHRRDKGAWPAKLEDCRRAGTSAADKAVNLCFTDPWGRPFVFKLLPHDNFAIVCWGADGKEDGKDHDADFVVTEREVRALQNSFRDDWWRWDSDNGVDWQVQDLAQDVLRFKQAYGKLPEELSELTRPGPAGKADAPRQAMRAALPRDRWENEYVYIKLSAEEFYVVGLGKDAIEGGIKDNKDAIHPVPGTEPARGGESDGFGPGMVMPEPDDNAALAEVASELMLEMIDKLNAHKADKGAWPATLDDIADQFVDEAVPLDPWEHEFIYTLTRDGDAVTGFTLTCLGSDGSSGGDDHAADITLNQDGEPVVKD